MCGRYYLDDEAVREIEKLVRYVDKNLGQQKTGDIHPSDNAPVLIGEKLGFSIKSMHWGFPKYQRQGFLINARAETVLEKKMFRDSVLGRRCVIPAKYFYEWDASKNKVTFGRAGNPAIYMAGFYNQFDDGKHFIILTTAANSSVERVHGRMPLILEEKELNDWLYDDRFLDFALHKIPPHLQSYQEYIQQSLF